MKNRNKMTKFPVARIKKIMQKDEEVGKVAQATPVVISKALELFLQLIVDEASSVTTSRGSKKVEAYHLKHAIETTEMLDFLKEIVEGVPDPSQGGTVSLNGPADDGTGHAKRQRKGKKPARADDEESGAEPAKRKRRKKPAPKDEEAEEDDRGREEGWDDE